MVAYCTATQVAAFLQVADFSGSTTPTTADVESFIEMSEARVDELTNHAWATARAKNVNDERGRIQKVRTNSINSVGRIQLAHYPVLAFTQHASPSLSQTNGTLKVWNANLYQDYLDTDNSKTMGSSVTDVVNKDFWMDTERGIIYIDNYNLFDTITDSPAGVDAYISYKYATASTPDDIKLATIYFTAATIAMNDDLNLMPEGDDSMDNATKSQRYEEMAIKILKDNGRLDRDMTMARAIGGFGTGMVTR
jgi:hypothetical protein